MKSLVAFVVFVMLAAAPGSAQEHCGFNITSAPHPDVHVIGKRAVTARVHILDQPESPVEIVAADLNGLAMVVTDDGYSYHSEEAAVIDIRNRSDQNIDYVFVRVVIGSCQAIGGNGVLGRPQRLSIPPGGTVRVGTLFGNGGGINSDPNPTGVFIWVSRVVLNDCLYQPAVTTVCRNDQ